MSDPQQRERLQQAIASFINNAPDGAVKLAVRERPTRPDVMAETLLMLDTAKSIERGPAQVAGLIYDQSAAWAEGRGSEATFTIHHLDKDNTALGGHLWRIENKSLPGMALHSGTTEGALANAQQHVHSVIALQLQSFELVIKGYKEIISMQAKRITELETRRDELEKKVASTDNSDNELAILSLESEGRTKLYELTEKALALFAGGKITMKEVGEGVRLIADASKAAAAAKPSEVATSTPPAAKDATPAAPPAAPADKPVPGAQ